MTKQMLSTRKMAMEKRQDWGFRGLNPQPIDRAGSKVSVAWNNVVTATDGGTDAQVEAAIAAAEEAEKQFYQEYPA